MSDLDVALRIRLERSGFREGERDLNNFERAAKALGVRRGTNPLADDIKAIGMEARGAGGAISAASGKVDVLDRQRLNRFVRAVGDAKVEAGRLAKSLDGADDEAERLDRRKLDRFRREIGRTVEASDRLKSKLGETAIVGPGLRRTGEAAAFLSGSATNAFNALAAFAAPTAILVGLDRLADKFREVDDLAASVALTAEMRDPKTRKSLVETNKTLGRETGASQADIAAARQVFVSGNVPIADQEKLLKPTLRAAIGADVSPETIAKAGRAYVQTMGGRPEEIEAAYDMMGKGGKLGSFELGAIARALPQLGTQYKSAGGTGLTGLSELIALAEVAAKGAGSEETAANNLSNYLSKLFSNETVKNFSEKGVDLEALVKQARTEGKHPALAVLDETQRLTGGNPFKMQDLFQDQQVMDALRPLMENRKLLEDYQRQIQNNSKGTVDLDYEYRQQTPAGREQIERGRREAAQITIGENVEPGSSFVSRATTRMTEDAARISGKGFLGGAWDLYTKINPFVGAPDAGIVGRYLNEPDNEDIDARRAEAEALSRQIEKEKAAVAASGRTLSWGADSRIAVRERRRTEILEGMKGDLSSAQEAVKEPGLPSLDTDNLEQRIDSLTKAIRDLEDRLKVPAAGVEPISLRDSARFGGARVWNASLGGGGSFAGAYSGSTPIMDGFAGASGSAAGGMTGAGRSVGGAATGGAYGAAPFLPGGPASSIETTRNPGGAAGELFDVFRATGNSDAQAIALLGHGQKESGLDPKAWNAGEQAGGILQWRGNRLANLKAFAADKGMDWQDRSVQGAFVRHEMEKDPYERKRSERFRAAKTVEEASAGLEDYVRFGDRSGPERLANAQRFAKEFGANRTPSGAAGLASVTYANSGATRRRPVTPDLLASIQRGVGAVYGEGYRAEIYSGGQGAKGSGLARVGSTRHDDHGAGGRAADLYVYGPDGKKVTGDELARLGQHWAATGEGGVGMEMRGGGIHLDEHKDRAKHWNYAGQGGRYTKGQAAAMRQGLAGIPPAYANPRALDPEPLKNARESLNGPDGGYDDNGWSKETNASRPVPSWKRLQDATPRPGAGAGPGRAPATPGRDMRPTVINQNFAGTDPGVQARRAQREQGKAIRMAEARALHDTAVPIS